MTKDSPKQPLKIVIGCDTFPPDINGAARFAERLAGGLVRRGHDVHIVAPAYSSKHGTFTEVHDEVKMTVHRVQSLKVLSHKTLRFIWPYTLKRKIDKLLDEIQPDAVHIQSHLIVGRYLVKSAKERGVRTIATNHIMPENLIKYSVIIPPFLQPWAMRMAWKDAGRVLRSVDAVTTPTRRAADLLEAAGGVSGVLPISCGIDASRFANETPTSNEVPRVLFLGRLDFEKHIHNLLKAVAKLPASLNTQVEIVGDGGERKHLNQLAETLGIADQVKFLGHISEEELPKVYERATVFAMPSIAELQSIATMEAMASGRPVVAADAMALPHLVHDGDNGYLFPPDDVDAFADRLLRVLTADADELERLSENSLHLIQSHDINRTLTIFEGLYRGDQAADKTSDDNRTEYAQPIGRLNKSMHTRVQRLRHRAYEVRQEFLALRDRAEDLGEDARERLEDLRDDMVRVAKRGRAKVRKQIRQATEIIRKDDE